MRNILVLTFVFICSAVFGQSNFFDIRKIDLDTFEITSLEKMNTTSDVVTSYRALSQHGEKMSITQYNEKWHVLVINKDGVAINFNSEEGRKVVEPSSLYVDCKMTPVDTYVEANPEAVGGCVQVYVEVDYDVFQDKGGDTEYFIYSLYDQVILLYEGANVTMEVSDVYVHTNGMAYPEATNNGSLLTAFGSANPTFDGNIANFITYRFSGGIAWLTSICSILPYSVSNIQPTFNSVPTYSWSVMVIAHECGHNLGSNHTQACVWGPDNNQAIDACPGWTEGSCAFPVPQIPPEGGGVMSYCHLTTAGINFNVAFAGEVGDVIRTYTEKSCFDVTCGVEPPPPPVEDSCTEFIITAMLDDRPWDIDYRFIKGDSFLLFRGNFDRNEHELATISDTMCLDTGCYVFILNDSYGDGLNGYCSTGEISLSWGDSVITVSDFGNSYVTEICLGTTPPEPSDTTYDKCVDFSIDSLLFYPQNFAYNVYTQDWIRVTGNNFTAVKTDTFTIDEQSEFSLNLREYPPHEAHYTAIGFALGDSLDLSNTFQLTGQYDVNLRQDLRITNSTFPFNQFVNLQIGDYVQGNFNRVILISSGVGFQTSTRFGWMRLLNPECTGVTLQIPQEYIEEVQKENNTEEYYYNILGQPVNINNVPTGVYFRYKGGKVEKILVTSPPRV